MIFTGNFRNLCSLDINSPEPVIAGLNNSLATFGTFYTNLKAILPTPLVGNAIDLSSITSIKAKVLPLSIKYLSIVNVTNPLVLDSVDVSTGMLQVKFLTAQTSNQAFTFDILYNNPGVDSIRQTINGSIPGQRSGVIVAGGNGQGSALNQLNNASGIWINSITKSIYVSDQLNNRVVKWDSGITSGVLIAGGNGVGAANNQLISPGGIWMDKSGNLFVADKNNNRVMEWTSGASKGIPVAGFASAINNDSMLSNPSSVFVDANNIIYVSDQGNNRVQKWVPGIDVSTGAGGNSFGVGANQLNNPSGIFVDANGNIYIADTYNNRIQKWQPGTIKGITVAGGNGLGSAANQLARPVGLYVDGAGNMYIADKDNNRIQKWAPGAYSGITVATGDCNGVFLDASGNIFVLNIADVTKWGPM